MARPTKSAQEREAEAWTRYEKTHATPCRCGHAQHEHMLGGEECGAHGPSDFGPGPRCPCKRFAAVTP